LDLRILQEHVFSEGAQESHTLPLISENFALPKSANAGQGGNEITDLDACILGFSVSVIWTWSNKKRVDV
jgi:hypothetical protein